MWFFWYPLTPLWSSVPLTKAVWTVVTHQKRINTVKFLGFSLSFLDFLRLHIANKSLSLSQFACSCRRCQTRTTSSTRTPAVRTAGPLVVKSPSKRPSRLLTSAKNLRPQPPHRSRPPRYPRTCRPHLRVRSPELSGLPPRNCRLGSLPLPHLRSRLLSPGLLE